MEHISKSVSIIWLVIVHSILLVSFFEFSPAQDAGKSNASGPGDQCVSCHSKLNQALVMEWQRSRHA